MTRVTLSTESADLSNADPILHLSDEIQRAFQQTGYRPNVMQLERYQWNLIREHPAFLERIKHSPLVGSLESLAIVLKLAKVEIMEDAS